jgi:hypothetical protein
VSAWTFIAQRAVTREMLDWDVPIAIDGLEWQLSGPGSLTGTVSPDVGALRTDDGRLLLEEWGTLIHAEHAGIIRWSGIVISCSFEGESFKIECAGYATYPHSVIYDGDFSGIGIDPATAFRHIWEHVQSYPDSDLGVTVTGDFTPTRMGEAAWTETTTDDDGTPRTTEHEAKPYVLSWIDAQNCGDEIEELVKLGPFDYAEAHRWDAAHEDVIHEIRVGYPRLGRRRDDLLFAQDANLTDVVPIDSNGDDYANTILGLGAGEGRAMLRRSTSIRDGRLRRVAVHSDKAVTDAARLDARIAEELNARKAALRITSLKVIDHENARLGSWELGDDVLVRAYLPWVGEVEMWVRILGWTLTGEHTATLDVSRSDLFRYGGTA